MNSVRALAAPVKNLCLLQSELWERSCASRAAGFFFFIPVQFHSDSARRFRSVMWILPSVAAAECRGDKSRHAYQVVGSLPKTCPERGATREAKPFWELVALYQLSGSFQLLPTDRG